MADERLGRGAGEKRERKGRHREEDRWKGREGEREIGREKERKERDGTVARNYPNETDNAGPQEPLTAS